MAEKRCRDRSLKAGSSADSQRHYQCAAGRARECNGAGVMRKRLWSTLVLAMAGAFPSTGCEEAPQQAEPGLRATLAADARASAGFKKAEQPVAFAFPRDHGAHPAFRNEWWYLTAVLATPAGREFGVQFTVFRQGIEPVEPGDGHEEGAAAWRTGQVFMGHVAVSDVAARRHYEAERFARGHPALAGATAQPFNVHLEGWRLGTAPAAAQRDPAAFWPLDLRAEAPQFAYALTLTGGKPVVPQGEAGLSRKGPGMASHYYSIVGIDAAGRVTVGGKTHAVSGSAWLDREWSTSALAADQVGWDWFALHLNDGRELMLYRMRRADGQPSRYNSGALIDAAGRARTLGPEDFSVTAKAHWREWPVAWRLALRGEAEAWQVRAAFPDQVMDTSIRYWEGLVHVYGAGGRRIGAGYVELTGY